MTSEQRDLDHLEEERSAQRPGKMGAWQECSGISQEVRWGWQGTTGLWKPTLST